MKHRIRTLAFQHRIYQGERLGRQPKGESVQRVALELGYENASGFVTMFRKAVGKPPARYLSDRMKSTQFAAVRGIVLHDHALVSGRERS
nr:helix-turn-helix domain-containing protein [Bordetella genomosp. 9]